MLVPGFTGSKEDFLTLLPELADRGWAAVAFDQFGQFESPASDAESDYTLDLLAADVLDVCAHFADPVHIVGHSFGAMVVAEAVLSSPGRFASVTILSCGLGAPGATQRYALEQLLAVPAGTPSAMVWQLRRELEGPLDPNLAPEIAAFVETKFVASPLAAMHGKAHALLETPDKSRELAAVGGRFLVATGVDDDYWPQEQQSALASTLGTSLVLLPGCGHSGAVDDPVLVATVFDSFWTSSDS